MFLLLFVTTGIGNGATFRMIPVIFRKKALKAVEGRGPEAEALALVQARRRSAAVLGFTGAIGACGGYLIPRAFGASIKATGGAEVALMVFMGFYATCVILTWVFYARRAAIAPSAGRQLAEARV
jgi:NNP family nitrate/nitrite transporter-like MFS transporter